MNRPVLFLSIALLVLAIVVDQSSAGDDDDWEQYKKTFGKAYKKDSDDESAHKKSFLNSQQQIKEHNAAFARGERTFQLGINHLSDLTPTEYSARNGYRRPKSGSNANVSSSASRFKRSMNLASSSPASVDWRQQGYVTPVKDQGQCGSCWAFSSTGALEGQLKRTTGNLVSLSEQNLVDCTTANWGCSGGWMDAAFQYVESNRGLDTESSYPYTATDGTCKFSKANVGVTVSGWTDIASGSEAALQQAVATMGPISVAIDASWPSFQNYRQGVYYEPQCTSANVDHAVLVVGYGTDPTLGDYWLVKNSWGSTWWGESGYIRMARNKNNNCAIATYASVPSTSTNKQCNSCTLNQLNIAGSSVVHSSITTNATTGCNEIIVACGGNTIDIRLLLSATNGNAQTYYCDTLSTSFICAATLVCNSNGQWYTTYSMNANAGQLGPPVNAISCQTF